MATQLLPAAECKNATSNGANIRKLHDGDGLYLWIYLDGRKYWRLRYWHAENSSPNSIMEPDCIAPPFFGLIHRHIRPLEDVFRAGFMIYEQRHADT